MLEQLVFMDEASLVGAPVPFLTINTVGPTLMHYGTEEQKQRFLPKILAGEMHFSIGYSEPAAGTDLASLTTRAVRDGDEYVINGQKMWTSLIQYADYVWLAARTDPDAPKHKGLSMFLVPTDAPGFSWTPVPTMAGTTTSATFYEDVRVPAANLVGEENQGWRLITNQLNHERVALCSAAGLQHSLADVRRWAHDTALADGRRVIDQEWVQVHLARVHAKVEFLKLINWKIAWGVQQRGRSTGRVGHQGLRHRAVDGGLPPADGGARPGGDRAAGLARLGAAQPAGARLPVDPDPHLRRRHQRGAARHHRHGRPRHAAGTALGGSMDFSLSEEQQEIAALARRILEDEVSEEVLRASEAGEVRFDLSTWEALADAGLLGIGLPEDAGGGGYGIVEQCLVLEEVGRTVAPVPVAASTVLGAAPIAVFGDDAQRQRWVRPAAVGGIVLTAALAEPGNRQPDQPATTATELGGRWRLDGAKTCVPAGTIADAVLVPATTAAGTSAVFVVERAAPGLRIEAQQVTNGDTEARLTLDALTVDADALLGGDRSGEVLEWMVQHATVALCAQQLGVLGKALEMTAGYTKQRVQFDRPIATFQAVGQRMADSYIDVEGLRLTLWQALWRLEQGLPAATEVEVAKFWASESAHRVAHAAVHLHGGTGIDRDYPLHRYFLAAKAIEFALGTATDQLLRIGRTLAATRE